MQYLAERVAGCDPSPGLTPYQGVRPVPAGTIVRLEQEHVSYRRYWSPYDVASKSVWEGSEQEAADVCRALLAESVRLRLTDNCTWAQLSGGLDSSSVVSIAQWLAARGAVPHGLAGTVTFVDPHGLGGDERRYSDAVAQRWNIRNVTIASSSARCDPPRTDEPTASIEAWARVTVSANACMRAVDACCSRVGAATRYSTVQCSSSLTGWSAAAHGPRFPRWPAEQRSAGPPSGSSPTVMPFSRCYPGLGNGVCYVVRERCHSGWIGQL